MVSDSEKIMRYFLHCLANSSMRISYIQALGYDMETRDLR
jgi:hypothetical protein